MKNTLSERYFSHENHIINKRFIIPITKIKTRRPVLTTRLYENVHFIVHFHKERILFDFKLKFT